MPAVHRTLEELGVTTKVASKSGPSPAAYAKLLKALSLLAMYDGIPLFSEIGRKILQLYPGNVHQTQIARHLRTYYRPPVVLEIRCRRPQRPAVDVQSPASTSLSSRIL